MALTGSIVGFFTSWVGLLFIGVLTALYFYGKWHNDIFKRRGIAHPKSLVFFGNTLGIFTRSYTFPEMFNNLYWLFPNESVMGFMQSTAPVFVIRDPEMIKEITVKKFDYFQNHVFSGDTVTDRVFTRSLFSMTDQKWKTTRNLISPAFTGSKMRIMYQLMQECCNRIVTALEEKCQQSETKDITLEMKDFFNRYANDTIATTAFGIEVNSIKDPENEFYQMGRKFTNFTGIGVTIKFFISLIAPKLFRIFKINLMDEKATDYFENIVKDMIEYRVKNKIVRHDVINMYIEDLKPDVNSKKDLENEYTVKLDNETDYTKKWDIEDFVGQCLLFFLAGFETTATLFTFMAYELTINPDIQKKLIEEIDEANRESGTDGISYEKLQSLKYLDWSLQESLRMWPVTIAVDRKCSKDITLENGEGKQFAFKEGDFINLPSMALQRDPQYYENPDKFMPERWSPENKDKINPFTFLTFGVGPRMCIGNRFAMVECKSIFYTLLSKFTLEKCEKTQYPVKIKKGTFALVPEKGMWLKLVPRKNVNI